MGTALFTRVKHYPTLFHNISTVRLFCCFCSSSEQPFPPTLSLFFPSPSSSHSVPSFHSFRLLFFLFLSLPLRLFHVPRPSHFSHLSFSLLSSSLRRYLSLFLTLSLSLPPSLFPSLPPSPIYPTMTFSHAPAATFPDHCLGSEPGVFALSTRSPFRPANGNTFCDRAHSRSKPRRRRQELIDPRAHGIHVSLTLNGNDRNLLQCHCAISYCSQ